MSGSKSSARAGTPESPLALAVHSLPATLPTEPRDARAARRGRLKMLLVLLVCASPVIASYFTFYVLRPQGQAVHGELLQPQRPLPAAAALPLQTLTGAPVDPASLRGQWLLVSVGGGACDAVCERQLYLQRQIREALGREKERVDRLWLIDDAAPVRAELLPALQGATVLRAPAEALAAWLPADADLSRRLYLVDPQGNLMMRFPAEPEFRKLQRDLGKLLRASASWDQPGR